MEDHPEVSFRNFQRESASFFFFFFADKHFVLNILETRPQQLEIEKAGNIFKELTTEISYYSIYQHFR